MNLPTPHISAEHSSRRHYQPVVCLLLWAVALKGEPARELLKALGVEEAEVDGMMDGMEPELAEMRRLRIVSELFDRERIGQLLRARLAEMLMQAHRPGELAQLAKAAQRMPGWVFGDEPVQESTAARSNNKRAHTPAHHAQARAGGHNGAPNSSPVLDAMDAADVDSDLPLGVHENGEPVTVMEAIGELNKLVGEVDRLDNCQATLDGFNKRDLHAELAGFMVPPGDGSPAEDESG